MTPTDTMDIGWGGTVSSPTNTVLGIIIKKEGGHQLRGNSPVKLQDLSLFRTQTTTKNAWHIEVYEGSYPDMATYMTALMALKVFLQYEPIFIKIYTNEFQKLHSTNWVQVMVQDDDINQERIGGGGVGFYPNNFVLEEVLPMDVTSVYP